MTATSGNGNLTSTGFQDADAYEQLMGRWSRLLAPMLIRFAGLWDGDRVLDVGCGPGSLTFALLEAANIASVTGIDLTESFVAAGRARATDPRISFDVGDALALPYGDATFDRAYSMLVLHFIADSARAVSEMRRVVRPGGTIAAAVWDNYGGQQFTRMLWDVATVLDPQVVPPYFRPLNSDGEMAALWRESGLYNVEQSSLTIRMTFRDFDDYWAPFATGEGPHGQYVARLTQTARETLKGQLRRAYVGNRPDGLRSMTASAWVCRGTVPA
jgi:ubiquinone/menaquinone biosynthesis C-methylase UbiE